MRKKVKSGIEKHYCDECGVLLYDIVPKNKITATIFGIPIPEYTIKSYCKSKCGYGKELCEKCYTTMTTIRRQKK